MIWTSIRSASCGILLVTLAAAIGNAQTTRTPPQRAQANTATRMPMMAAVDTALLRGLNYRLVGHSRGGRVTTVTG
ncbi:MAG TPA: hypothetical protein VFZ73_07845, partial [Gemmatimonadaceae bacterium]